MTLGLQITWLFILALPIACISWTVTHEEIFREPREYFIRKSTTCPTFWQWKFFYLFTCEYCFSHYVTVAMLLITSFTLLFDDWRGYVISGFSLVWIANVYMTLFALVRQGVKSEKLEAELKEEQLSK